MIARAQQQYDTNNTQQTATQLGWMPLPSHNQDHLQFHNRSIAPQQSPLNSSCYCNSSKGIIAAAIVIGIGLQFSAFSVSNIIARGSLKCRRRS